MKIIHIESGLGNQMLSYAEYLVLKKLNPDDTSYIETLVYDIPECEEIISQWNGFELESIFGINAPNIKEQFTMEQWNNVLEKVRLSRFWENNWNYPPEIVKALNSEGLSIINHRGNVEFIASKTIRSKLTNNLLGYTVKRILRPLYQDKYISSKNLKEKMFVESDDNIFTGQFLGLKNKDSNIEFIDKEIRETFKFPPILNKSNLDMIKIIQSENSVAIHARRGDMLQSNGYCYKYGYFKRAVNYIKKNVESPLYIFFCDPGSVEWCKNNASIFGLDFNKDKVLFVDWNKGKESYRDMQLMAECKHNIITNSSFGWWGAYLNENPDKITCSPSVYIQTTHTF